MTKRIRNPKELFGVPVRSSDGQALGEVGIVYLPDGRRQPLLVGMPVNRRDSRVVPMFGARLDDDALVLAYPAELITAGPTVDSEEPLSAGEVIAALAHYQPAVLEAARGVPLTEHGPQGADVSASRGRLDRIPAFPGIGDDDLPPIVITSPGALGDAR